MGGNILTPLSNLVSPQLYFWFLNDSTSSTAPALFHLQSSYSSLFSLATSVFISVGPSLSSQAKCEAVQIGGLCFLPDKDESCLQRQEFLLPEIWQNPLKLLLQQLQFDR